MNKNTINEWKNTDTAGDGCSDVKIFQSQGSLAARDNDPPCATPIGSHFERSHLGRGTVYMRSQAVRQGGAVTLVTPKIHMYPGGYCPTPVTPRIHRVLLGIRIWSSLANTFVKITKNSATSIEYENWDNISWPHQILRRNYMKFVFWICDRAQLKARFLAQWNISNITIKMFWNGSNK